MRFYLYDADDATDADDRFIDDAGKRIRDVAALWTLLGSDRGPKMLDLLERMRSTPRDVELNQQLVDLFEIEELRGLVDGIVEEAAPIVTPDWRIRTEVVERVIATAPAIVTFIDDHVPSLAHVLANAVDLVTYTTRAIHLGSRIAID